MSSEEQPETKAGAANDATDAIDGNLADAQGETQFAWSHDQDEADDAEHSESHPWNVVTGQAAALISAGAAVATVTAVLGWILLHKDSPTPSPPAARSTPASAPAQSSLPSPATVTMSSPAVTVQAAPPAGVGATPSLSSYDQNFISLMAQEGWGCVGGASPVTDEYCRKEMLGFAHQICAYNGQSITLIYQNFGIPLYFGPREERRAIANAEQAYPNCTFTGDF